MANLTSVSVTSGIPSSGTGTVSTIDQLLAVGSPISNGTSSVLVNVVSPSSVVTSSMIGLAAAISYISTNAALQTVTSLSSGTVAIANGANTVAVTGNASAPTSSMNALVFALSPNGINANGQATMANSAPVVLASDQSLLRFSVNSSGGTNIAYVVAGSSAVTSTMAALVVALSTLGAASGGGSSTVGLSSAVTLTPVNTLWAAGSSNNGLLTSSAVTLISTELVSLGSSVMAISANTGSAGKFTSSNTGQAVYGEIFITCTTTATTVAGANFAGWFMVSPDSGTTYETTSFTPLARAPDFVIPLPTGTLGSSTTYKAAGPVMLPSLQFKVALQNNMGITLPSSASGNPSVLLAPMAQQGG